MTLSISEKFYSVQAEGATTGVPAYFIRLRGCNLLCGNPNMKNVKDKTDQAEIEANQDPNATWICDTIAVWLQGSKVSSGELVNDLKEDGQLENIMNGYTHIVWTGGEPTMPIHRKGIMDVMDYMMNYADAAGMNFTPYTELETNGSIHVPQQDQVFFDKYINQINCSPKLANSGMPASRRINLKALEQINNHRNSYFKFVVSSREDILEAQRDFIEPVGIDRKKIILMPGLNKREDYHERGEFIYEMAKEFNYRAINRGHISAWDKKTGV